MIKITLDISYPGLTEEDKKQIAEHFLQELRHKVLMVAGNHQLNHGEFMRSQHLNVVAKSEIL